MDDYISREEAIMAVTRARLPDTTPDGVPIANGKRSVTDCVRRIKDIPAADVRPVVRGKWKLEDDGALFYRCSVCGKAMHGWFAEIYIGDGHYCPNCGADMREES